tara:strand:- start:398 stop:565 length:168 start_codon:yes stop_codon:yes gene_type:complete
MTLVMIVVVMCTFQMDMHLFQKQPERLYSQTQRGHADVHKAEEVTHRHATNLIHL